MGERFTGINGTKNVCKTSRNNKQTRQTQTPDAKKSHRSNGKEETNQVTYLMQAVRKERAEGGSAYVER